MDIIKETKFDLGDVVYHKNDIRMKFTVTEIHTVTCEAGTQVFYSVRQMVEGESVQGIARETIKLAELELLGPPRVREVISSTGTMSCKDDNKYTLEGRG